MYIVGYFPIVKYLGSLIVDQKMIEGRKDYMNWVSDQVSKRLAKETDRPDFMTYITSHNGEKGTTLSKDRLDSNANLILTAGSETTATLLSGATYLVSSIKILSPFCISPKHKKKKKTKTNPLLLLLLLLQKLLKNPSKLTLLTHEIRSTWPTYNSITLSAVNNSAPYLIAVLNESLRYFPPVPTGFERRISQPGGEVISGVFIPEGTAVQVSQWAAHHSEENFADPEEFVPERWLDGEDGMGDDGKGKGNKWKREEKYEGDRRGAMQPFSFGPRNCLGKVSFFFPLFFSLSLSPNT